VVRERAFARVLWRAFQRFLSRRGRGPSVEGAKKPVRENPKDRYVELLNDLDRRGGNASLTCRWSTSIAYKSKLVEQD